MTRLETERLRNRIQQLRHALAPSDIPAAGPRGPEPGAGGEIEDLHTRIAHLEQLVQGLQDSVYRESLRLDRRLTELETRTEPAALAAALSENARNRGL